MAEEFKQRLIKARKQKGLTQVQTAKIANITQGAYSRLETGDAANTKHLAALAAALEINLEWLVYGKGKMYGTTDNEIAKKIQDDIAEIDDIATLKAIQSIVDQLKKNKPI